MLGLCGNIAWQSNTCFTTQLQLGTIYCLVSPAQVSCLQTASGLQLKTMDSAWKNKALAKYSINSMIGLWAINSTHVYHAKTSNDTLDAKGSHTRRQVEYGDGHAIYDHIFATKVLGNTSFRPIHDQIMHTEATRMAQLCFILSSLGIPQRSIKDVKQTLSFLSKFQIHAKRLWGTLPM